MRSSRSGRPGRGKTDDPLWYKDAIIYEVRTRSFFDSNGDGIGDLRGLTSKLDYLADLGITALWLLPHYPSPGRDDGYDCSDYTSVHEHVGTLDDFDELVKEAHQRGLRIITELVMNHTSDAHPWFQRARRAPRGSAERDFYVWSDTADKYKDARIIFRDFEPANWTWDPIAQSHFWHRFFSHQPDLNFENPAVHEAMLGVVDFWMARGVDGLRLDAVPYLYEAEGTNCENLPATHAFLKKLRAHVDARFPNRMLLAEANQWPEDAAAYFGNGDECHMNFHFPIMPRLFMSIHMEDRFPIIDILMQTPELHPTCQWAMFLRNHDELTLEMVTDEERDYMVRAYAHDVEMRINLGIRRRLAPLVQNDRKKMQLLNGLLFSMPGTPVLYYGDEIGMGDNVYLGDRNGVRTPMQWSADRNAGFSRANPQRLILPIIIDPEYHFEALNVEMQQSNANSLLWWTKRLVALRKRFRAFGRGSVEFLHPSNPRVLAFIRHFEDETILVVANLSRHVQYAELDLSSSKGVIPVELFGRTRFPTVTDAPYMLSLGGHDFYWFTLEPPRPTEQEERMSLHGASVIACSSVDELLFGSERSLLEEVLPSFLDARGWLSARHGVAHVVESIRLFDSIALVFVRVEYDDAEPDTFALTLVALRELPPDAATSLVANVHVLERTQYLVDATVHGASNALVDAIATDGSFTATAGRVVAKAIHPSSFEDRADGDVRVVSTNRLGASIAYGQSFVLKLFHRMEEGTAPELEVGRFMDAKGFTGITPRILGYVEYRAPRAEEAVTLAVIEEYVQNEGTAWQQARNDIGRAYDRVLAHPADAPPPTVPRDPLLDLAFRDIPAEHAELIGAHADWMRLLGRRTADLHRALASSTEPAFEAQSYAALDQRSKYQTARNLIGRVLASMRRSFGDLPPGIREGAERLLAHEADVLARFEPLLTQRIDSQKIRYHGDLHLGRALFTGKDYVLVGVGGGRDRRLSERRRKGNVLRDVAGMVRSLHYAAATTLGGLRPEDQTRAEAWGWIWQRWASAAYLRGYLDAVNDAAFLPRNPQVLSLMLETALLEKAFAELRNELRRRPEMAWIPLQGIQRLMNLV